MIYRKCFNIFVLYLKRLVQNIICYNSWELCAFDLCNLLALNKSVSWIGYCYSLIWLRTCVLLICKNSWLLFNQISFFMSSWFVKVSSSERFLPLTKKLCCLQIWHGCHCHIPEITAGPKYMVWNFAFTPSIETCCCLINKLLSWGWLLIP